MSKSRKRPTDQQRPTRPSADPAPARETDAERRAQDHASLVEVLGPPVIILTILALAGGVVAALVAADYYHQAPPVAQATYVGRQSCVQCHQEQHQDWLGSHHDLAMDVANEETVLGDFSGVTLEHYGPTSRMFRDGDKFMVRTEGPDGTTRDYEVKYVFGVHPLQQYMVEVEREPGQPESEVGRVQVLRESWDVERKRWFYLMPPDVDERILPGDPLHWTGAASNWNHMCADCHSTNLVKHHDPKTDKYHTTFSEIDVSCETCHGPGSVHVELAENKWFFWDREQGYGLPDLTSDPYVKMDTCFRCHSRRRIIKAGSCGGQAFYDNMINELLMPHTYYPDGQILDEVYVHGSFIQSKMYHAGVSCSDCHDPHTARLKQEGNAVCTTCHMEKGHLAVKYDTPKHHFHEKGGTGASCVECHMPESTYMMVDPRRDHSMRSPRPDLSVALGVPNACTRCHLDRAKELVDPALAAALGDDYGQWMQAKREGDEAVAAALAEVDQWSLKWVREWYGGEIERTPSVATALKPAWDQVAGPQTIKELEDIIFDKETPAILRATALTALTGVDFERATEVAREMLDDARPQVRIAAAGVFRDFFTANAAAARDGDALTKDIAALARRLKDQLRGVRVEAARALAPVAGSIRGRSGREAFAAALEEYKDSLDNNSDQPGAHVAYGALYEALGESGYLEDPVTAQQKAIAAYRAAIRIAPGVAGPRSNLAELLERTRGEQAAEEVARLRREELALIERDAKLAPNVAGLQYQLGMAYYLQGKLDEAEAALKKATEINPNEPQFWLGLCLLLERREKFEQSLAAAKKLVELDPSNRMYQQVLVQQQIQAARGPTEKPLPNH